jgi:UDP-N-acetylglucosamine--N-acetylmuramyl-(pentapeptide) pyrophosphoryl-undecaprenol N-acetylglucosamine transferase
VIVAGGTGGHILPGIRIGEALDAQGPAPFAVEYISGPRPIEREVYRGEGVTPQVIATGGYRGAGRQIVQCAEFAFDVARLTARFLHHRPAGVLAMGGAASFPVLCAAIALGIPIFLHESNRIPGRVIRLFNRFARRVFLGLGGLQGANVEITGTPTRTPARSDAARDVVLCVGGSQGSARLNELFLQAAEGLTTKHPDMRFILVAGPAAGGLQSQTVEIRGYEPKLAELLSRTVVIVSRAGAGALADVANFRLPSILIPYPHAKDDHQRANAMALVSQGAAIFCDEAGLTSNALATELEGLLSSASRREDLAQALTPFDSTHSASMIAESIVRAIAPVADSRRISQGLHP